jgi:hypothetical protein
MSCSALATRTGCPPRASGRLARSSHVRARALLAVALAASALLAAPASAVAKTWPHHLVMTGVAMLAPRTGTLLVDAYTRSQYRYHFPSSKSATQFARYYAPRRVTLKALGHTLRFTARNECYDPFIEGPQTLWDLTVGPPSAFIGKRLKLLFTNGEGRHKLTMKIRRKNVAPNPGACHFTPELVHAGGK